MSIKKWLKNNMRAVVGIADIQEECRILQQNNQEIREGINEITKLFEQHKESLSSSNILQDQARIEELSKRCLFVVGNARSGTTVLADSLNRSSDIFLLIESDLYDNYRREDFVSFYYEKHANMGTTRAKGAFIPPLPIGPLRGIEYLEQLSRDFRYVGEKFAFVPVRGQHRQQLFFAHHAKYFYFSKYLIIIRHPFEAVMSMRKMFPDKPLEVLVEGWLNTLSLSIDLLTCFPNTWTIFQDALSEKTIARIGEILGVEIPVHEGVLGKRDIHTHVDHDKVPEELSRLSPVLLDCSILYDKYKENFCPDLLTYTGASFAHKYFRPLMNKILELLAVLDTTNSEKNPE